MQVNIVFGNNLVFKQIYFSRALSALAEAFVKGLFINWNNYQKIDIHNQVEDNNFYYCFVQMFFILV